MKITLNQLKELIKEQIIKKTKNGTKIDYSKSSIELPEQAQKWTNEKNGKYLGLYAIDEKEKNIIFKSGNKINFDKILKHKSVNGSEYYLLGNQRGQIYMERGRKGSSSFEVYYQTYLISKRWN